MADGGQENKPKVVKTDAEWKQQLTPLQYNVARKAGTERAFSDNGHDNKEQGLYRCVCCGTPLFPSNTKYNSGTGWPSFFAPSIKMRWIFAMIAACFRGAPRWSAPPAMRIWAMCSKTGPSPPGLRFCMNGAALKFEKQ